MSIRFIKTARRGQCAPLAVAFTALLAPWALAEGDPAPRPAERPGVAASPNGSSQGGASGANPHPENDSSEKPSLEDSAILPSTGNDGETAAPSMALDCENDPDSCQTPLTAPSEGPSLTTPDANPAGADHGAPVVAPSND